MPQGVRFAVEGLRDLMGRFASLQDHKIQQRQDEALRNVAALAKGELRAAAPRGPGPGPHLADLFVVGQLQRQGYSATIALNNTRTVTTKAGQTYSLLRLINPPGTAPHDIPGAFGFALPFGIGGRFAGKFHPGYPGNPFVEQTMRTLDPRSVLMQTARGVVVDLVGGQAEE